MAHQDAVPVDQRWLGMDRRGIPYAVVTLVLIALLHWGIPALDDAISWDDPTVAGDVLDVGSGLRMTPPVGWQLEDGVRTSDETVNPKTADGSRVTLANGAVTITVTAAKWDGTAAELMTQSNRIRTTSDEDADRLFAVTGDTTSFTTSSGVTGVQEAYTSAGGDGRSFALVVEDARGDTIGVVVSATSSDDSLSEFDRQIEDFVSSLTTVEEPNS